jgi:uncharacterized protein with von Willebrand factor type A (vWA) domain
VNGSARSFSARCDQLNNELKLTAPGRFQLARRVMQSPKLRMIAEMCGRFTRLALAIQKSRVDYPPGQITAITTGADLAHLLPDELALLSEPDLEDLFYLRLTERRLFQYELEGREPEGRGPVILALDESGSMEESAGGIAKDAWNKSVMPGLLALHSAVATARIAGQTRCAP